jgi:UDP-glucose 4-epimerase
MTNFWKDKRACVVGGAGFVGIHLVKQLLDAGAIVTVLDNLSRGKKNSLPTETFSKTSNTFSIWLPGSLAWTTIKRIRQKCTIKTGLHR